MAMSAVLHSAPRALRLRLGRSHSNMGPSPAEFKPGKSPIADSFRHPAPQLSKARAKTQARLSHAAEKSSFFRIGGGPVWCPGPSSPRVWRDKSRNQFQSYTNVNYTPESAPEICLESAPLIILEARLDLAQDTDSLEKLKRLEKGVSGALAFADLEIRRAAWTGRQPSLDGADDPKDWLKAELAYRAALDQGWRNADLSALLTQSGLEPDRETIRYATTLMTYRYACYKDLENTLWLKKQLQFIDWFRISVYGEDADLNAWLIAQHSVQDPAFQRDVLERLERLAKEGETNPKYFALLWDRVAIFTGEKQKYGTQFTCGEESVLEPSPLKAPERVDAFRSEVGLEPLSDNSLLGQPC